MRRYGQWAGNPQGVPEDVEFCAFEVKGDRWGISRQCQRRRGHGPNKDYCKGHGKKVDANPNLAKT